jgi:hypothetical protein
MTSFRRGLVSVLCLLLWGSALIWMTFFWIDVGHAENPGGRLALAVLSFVLLMSAFPIVLTVFARVVEVREAGLAAGREIFRPLMLLIFLTVLLPILLAVWWGTVQPFETYNFSSFAICNGLINLALLPHILSLSHRLCLTLGRRPRMVNPILVAVGFALAFTISGVLIRMEGGGLDHPGPLELAKGMILPFIILTPILYLVLRWILPSQAKLDGMQTAKS